ncbi:conserved hypothetical protein [Ricinus communis]|uniref:Uncharacterized protein n=1 Tax=Ricinus communis TaxID=3988 RepID=B9SAU0_RICCO|nr:conserved hypothetical protein [Ricinus communis]
MTKVARMNDSNSDGDRGIKGDLLINIDSDFVIGGDEKDGGGWAAELAVVILN